MTLWTSGASKRGGPSGNAGRFPVGGSSSCGEPSRAACNATRRAPDARCQKITNPSGFWGNVDVRGNRVVAAKNAMMIYRVDASREQPLVAAKEASGHASTWGEGLCLYDQGAPGLSGGLYGVNNVRDTFRVRMHPLTDGDADGLLTIGGHVKEFYLGSEPEGFVVDDATGHRFISEEDVAIWR